MGCACGRLNVTGFLIELAYTPESSLQESTAVKNVVKREKILFIQLDGGQFHVRRYFAVDHGSETRKEVKMLKFF